MRKITKLMFTLALLVTGVGVANAERVYADLSQYGDKWDGTDVSFSWTASWGNQLSPNLDAVGLPKGDLRKWEKLVVVVDELNNCDFFRVLVYSGDDSGHNNTFICDKTGANEFTLEGNVDFLNNVTRICLSGSNNSDTQSSSWSEETPASFKVKEVYLEYQSTKTLAADLSVLPSTSENTTWTWDAETSTGTFAWSDKNYNSTELFGAGNYSAYTTLNLVTTAGTADHFRVILKFTNGAAQVTINSVAAGTVSLNLADYTTAENLANVQTIRLSGASDVLTGDVTVSSVYLEGPNIRYIEVSEVFEAPTGTTDLNGMTGAGEIRWTLTYPIEMGPAVGIGGNLDGDNNSVDITSYDYLHFVVTSVDAGKKLSARVFVSEENLSDNTKRHCLYLRPIADAANPSTNWESVYYITEPGTYVAKVSDYPLLRGIKGGNGWEGDESNGNITIPQAYLSSGAPIEYVSTGKYTLFGEATGSASLTAALADANATYFDATGVFGTGVDLSGAANPNALFKANAGVLANTQNVIVGGTCENLVLTDGHPFKAPADFTATTASYKTTINAEAGAGTLCLPFAATIPAGVTAYTLTYTSGDKATATAVETTIPANTPVLLNGSGETTFTGSGAVVAEAANTAGNMTGVFASVAVPTGSYVLQNGDDGVGFYNVTTNDITINPFRAYLTASAGVHSLTVDYQNGEETGIEEMRNGENEKMRSEIFDLSGRRVVKAQKGIYIVNGKKIVK